MVKLISGVFIKNENEQVRIKQKGHVAECRLWSKSRSGRWKSTDRVVTVPIDKVVATWKECEALNAKTKIVGQRILESYEEFIILGEKANELADRLKAENESARKRVDEALLELLK
jgi:hypothetical protein